MDGGAIPDIRREMGGAMRETGNRLSNTVTGARFFSPKDRIDHSVFGLGTIVEIDERHTTIAFDDAGTRKFVTSMVKLASSDTPKPKKRVRARKKRTGRSR
jgi:hypothetical protein